MSLNSIADYFLPGSYWLALIAASVCVPFLWGKEAARRRARLYLTAVTLFYLALSTGIGAHLWGAPLRQHEAFIADAAAARGATAVVLLTPSAGMIRARGIEIGEVDGLGELRLLETVRVYRLLGNPWVILSGGFPDITDRPSMSAVATNILVQLGVPRDRILIDGTSRNTHEHPSHVAPMLKAHGVTRFVLVTSPDHMWRAAATFRKAGLDFVPSAASRDLESTDPDKPFGMGPWNLDDVRAASHEYVGLLYYWLRGWL